MSSRPAIGTFEPNATYAGDERARKFWRLSFRSGRDYINGKDASGAAVLINHEREEQQSYQRRLRTTKPRNFVGPITRLYNDAVFRKEPVRSSEDEFWTNFWADCDGLGTSLDTFMKNALMIAQVDRESYIVPDVQGALEGAVTVAAINAAGSRPTVCRVSASAVLDWTEVGGALVDCVMLWQRADGQAVLRWWGTTMRQDFVLDAKKLEANELVITAAEPETAHGYDCMPVVRLRPNFDPLGRIDDSLGDSQAGPMAESQQAITNLISLLNEEISNVTFSQMIASGVSEAQVKGVMVGSNRIICLPNPVAKVDMIGALPEQAESIRKQVVDERDYLFNMAGISENSSDRVQSGKALAFRHNDRATIIAALANATEEAENSITANIADAWGIDEPTETDYQGNDADLPAFDGEAATLIAIVGNASLPEVIRLKVAERFAARNLKLDDADMKLLASQVADATATTAAADSSNPFPKAINERAAFGSVTAAPQQLAETA